ncbi:transporter [Halobellus captivus]|uniref:transporter n=1 Tax=Halobellus captivus TaxID=2592614 RepID=UPI0011A74F98|nr:transporter [Halobellus captivus]
MSRPESTATTDGIAPASRTLGMGAIAGLLSYAITYAITYAMTGEQIANSLAARILELATGDPGTWKLVGWVFYSTHYVTSEIPGLFGSTAVNLISRGDGFSAALFVIPPVVLLIAGGLVAVVGRAETPLSGAFGGASVAIGYLPLAIAGAFLFSISVGDSTAGPTLVTAALLAGLVYPLVFGGVGGALGSFVSNR